MKDEIFRKNQHVLTEFEFNQDVASVFDDMAERSIPFYQTVQHMQLDFLDYFHLAGSRFYDLGCSTGQLMAQVLADERFQFEKVCGFDMSEPMLAQAKKRLSGFPESAWSLHCEDIREADFPNAGAIVLDYTLQFIRPLMRPRILKKIYKSLQPGGVLLISEKVLERSGFMSRLFQEMYLHFKRQKGYSDLEISQKRDKLEHVLVPYQVDEILELLHEAGFKNTDLFFKWHNFASFLAVKPL